MNIQMIKNVGFFFLLISVNACQSTGVKSDNQASCLEPRPDMCTMDYQPVCGFNVDNGSKTFSNGCAACSDRSVVKYINNECLED